MKKLNQIVAEERRPICENCPADKYDAATDCCLAVAQIGNPTRRGRLDHQYGIPNPLTKCPFDCWDRIYCDHTIMITDKFGLDAYTKDYLETHRVTKNSILSWAQKLKRDFPLPSQEGDGELPLSYYHNWLMELLKTKNDYTYYMRSQNK